jgi:hypothetical protein
MGGSSFEFPGSAVTNSLLAGEIDTLGAWKLQQNGWNECNAEAGMVQGNRGSGCLGGVS